MSSQEIVHIKALAEKREYAAALEACQVLLNRGREGKFDVLRTRAYVQARSGNYDLALADRRAIIDSGEAQLRDYFLAADCAMQNESFDTAIAWFVESLALGDQEGQQWYRSASLFYLAYCEMRSGLLERAMYSLNLAVSVEHNVSLPLPGMGMCSHERLSSEIRRLAHAQDGNGGN